LADNDLKTAEIPDKSKAGKKIKNDINAFQMELRTTYTRTETSG
jgi:hypothetical protein